MDLAESKKSTGVSGRFVVSELAAMGELLAIMGQGRRSESFLNASRGRAAAEIVAEVDGVSIRAPGRGVLRDRLLAIRGVGAAIATFIEEVAAGGSAELSRMRSDPVLMAKKLFSGVLGVGPAAAAEWVKVGLTIPDIRRAAADGRITLTQIQRCGLGFYDDLRLRIPREEVSEIAGVIGAIARAAGAVSWEIAGSYRRGLPTAGDVDLIVAGSAEVGRILPRMMAELESREEFLCKIMAGQQRASFIWRWRGRARQVDILVTPPGSYWAAVVYFTGSFDFNEAMRGVAKSRGMRLNQMGLYSAGKLVPTKNEREVFSKVGIRWVEPQFRTGTAAVVEL